MRAAFDDLAFFDDEDAIRGADGGKPMGDDEADPALEDGFEALLDQLLGLGVDGGSRFVHDENPRVREQGAGEGNELFLAGGESVAALADISIVAFL